ncbi:hypothetical protein FB45DRAFT_905928 [Roridomyces roridus]|uniref:F-box domain-containing protein n=1 Tax=Roridomyces roridus TaxID=1738132 RepID=A0AAD7FVB0_9AGAR|nr:hypothetical protein FB45DRAFT_905928 [Roridomyces roridus]
MSASFFLTEIARLDHQLDALDAQIVLVRAERDRAARVLQAIVYPVLSLPSEITTEIFIHYVDVDPRRSPLPLTWICRTWRELARSSSSLWSSFDSKLHPNASLLDSPFPWPRLGFASGSPSICALGGSGHIGRLVWMFGAVADTEAISFFFHSTSLRFARSITCARETVVSI